MSSSIHSPSPDAAKNERVTVRIPRAQLDNVEDLVEAGEYPSVSEAFRDAVREKFSEDGDRR